MPSPRATQGSIRKEINLYAQDLHLELNYLFQKLYKAQKVYKLFKKLNSIKKKSSFKKLKNNYVRIKKVFNAGLREFNKGICIEQKRLQLLKKHKCMLINRKKLTFSKNES